MSDREGWKQRALACELSNEELTAKVAELETRLYGSGPTHYDRIEVAEARVAELEGELSASRESEADWSNEVASLQAQLDRAKETNESLALKMGMLVEELTNATCGEEWDPAKYVATKTPEEIRAAGHKWADERATIRELRDQLDRATSDSEKWRAYQSAPATIMTEPPEYEGEIDEGAEHYGVVEFPGGRRRDDVAAELDRKPAEPRPALPKGMRRPHIMDTQLYDIAEAEGVPEGMYELLAYAQTLEEMQAQEPRPMSEAPKGGTEISLVMRAMYVRGMGWVVDRETKPIGWLPTTTAAGGSEWPEHGEGWSDEAMLAGGGGDES